MTRRPQITTPPTPPGMRVSASRRVLDVVGSGLGLVLLMPVLLGAALLVLLVDGRPVFFRQVRVGEGGRPFVIYKFRTMRPTGTGPEVTAVGDQRVTSVGRLLRRTSVDELPQLWHVLRGQMTLVGPRPETEGLARRYPASCREVLMARPGLTGPVQLSFRERSAVPPPGWPDVESWYLDVLVPLRSRADMEYLTRPTLGRTLHHLLLTALFVVGLVHLERPVISASEQSAPIG